jgi:4'-phosphopantetheinyl transferase
MSDAPESTRPGPGWEALPASGEVELLWLPAPAGDLQDPDASTRERLLRYALAPLLGRRPHALEFAREPRGRPYLRDAPAGFDFNFSGTRGGSLLAVSLGLRVGVDIERLDRRPPVLRLARRYFDPGEADALEALPDALRTTAFLHAWTAKEAACKATGSGLRERLAAWRFRIEAGSDDPELLQAPSEAGDRAAWSLRRLNPAPGFTAVLAAAGPIRALRLRTSASDQSAG